MRRVVRVGLIVTGAVGFLFALASLARADVVDPASVLESSSPAMVDKMFAGAENEGVLVPAMPLEQPFFSGLDLGDEAVATPAPEQVVTQAPVAVTTRAHVDGGTVVDRAVQGVGEGFRDIGAFLGRVASACQVGLATGAGGPLLVFAVLGMMAPFIRRQVFGTRRAADEDAPELLYAWEVISPG